MSQAKLKIMVTILYCRKIVILCRGKLIFNIILQLRLKNKYMNFKKRQIVIALLFCCFLAVH
jgi:hypothetical protein